jgi:HAMP domain.
MSTNFPERRKNFYIKKEFQRNFILKFCALIVAGSVISGLIMYAMSACTVTTAFENLRLTIKSTADYILPMVLFSSIVVLILIGIATIAVTLFTSHKIAGPLYAIEKRVDDVAALNLKTEFRLRTGDEIKPLAVGLDVMVSNLRKAVKEIDKSLSEFEAVMGKPGCANMQPEARNKLEELKKAIEKFTT